MSAVAPVLDHAQHAYTLGGKPLVSVSKVVAALIKSTLKDVDEEILRKAATRGTWVENLSTDLMRHGFVSAVRPAELIDAYWDEVWTGVIRRMEIFEQWWRNAQPVLLDAQRVVWSESDGTAGTLDWLLNVGGKRYLIDLKCTSQPAGTWILQLGAYASMLDEPVDGVAIMHIKPEYSHGYIFREYDQDRAKAYWQRALQWYRILQELKAEAAE